LKTYLLIALACWMVAAPLYGQEKPDPSKDIELNQEEKEILQLNQRKIDRINKRIADFNEQLKADEQEVAAERDEIVKAFMKAHGIDQAHWNLLGNGKFVEAPAKQPELKKSETPVFPAKKK